MPPISVRYRSVVFLFVFPSVTLLWSSRLSHSCTTLRLLDWIKCHLSATLMWSQVTFYWTMATVSTGRGDLGVGNPSFQRWRLSPNYFGPCLFFFDVGTVCYSLTGLLNHLLVHVSLSSIMCSFLLILTYTNLQRDDKYLYTFCLHWMKNIKKP